MEWNLHKFCNRSPYVQQNRDSILVSVDKVTRIVPLAPFGKSINATDTTRFLWNTDVKLSTAPRVIYSYEGMSSLQVVGRNCGGAQELDDCLVQFTIHRHKGW